MIRKWLFTGLVSTTLVVGLLRCTEIQYDNPIDIDGVNRNWLLENPDAMEDPDGDGIANYFSNPDIYQPKDSIPPVITILGGDTVRIPTGDPQERVAFYSKEIKVTDNSGGPITTIPPESDVNIFVVNAPNAPYTIKYQAIDSSGNIATATRYVHVFKADSKDTKPPIITISETTVYMQVNTKFNDPGVSVYDEHDGPIPSTSVVVTGTVNASAVGEYTLTYSVKDAAGNEGKATRKVVVQKEPIGPDRTNPVITLKGADTVKVPASVTMPEFLGTYKDAGATATDNIDGDISSKIRTGDPTQLDGSIWYITYDVTDAAGNAAPTVKRIIKTPYSAIITPPIIDLEFPDSVILLVLPSSGKTKWQEPGYTASDVIDGDLTSKVIVDSANLVANLGKMGDYLVTYSVTNSNKLRATKTRQVKIVDNPFDVVPPVITLLGRNPDTALAKDPNGYKDPGWTAIDNRDGDVSANVTKSGTVNLAAIGKYTLSYAVTDKAGLVGRASRVVWVVRDTASKDLLTRYVVPTESPLPMLANKTYKTVEVDGEGPDVSTIKSMTINWDAGVGQIYSFQIQVTGEPYNVDLQRTAQTFKSAKPTLTLSGSKIPGFDAVYYVTVQGTEFIWVEKTGKYALIWQQ